MFKRSFDKEIAINNPLQSMLLAVLLCITTWTQPMHVNTQDYKLTTIFALATAGICILVGYWIGYHNHTSSEAIPPVREMASNSNMLPKARSNAVDAITVLQSFSNSPRIKRLVSKQMREGGNQNEEDVKNKILGMELQQLHHSYHQTAILKKKAPDSRLGAYCPYDMQDPHNLQVLDILAQQKIKKPTNKKPGWWADCFNKRLLSLQSPESKPVQKATRHRRSLIRFYGNDEKKSD